MVDLPGLPVSDDFRFVFAWVDSRKPGRLGESSPSAMSGVFEMGSATVGTDTILNNNAQEIAFDLAGVLKTGTAYVRNDPPAGVDGVAVYVHRAVWGMDPLSGFPNFRLLFEAPLPGPTLLGGFRRIVTFTGQRSESAMLLERSPLWLLRPIPPCRCSVSDGERMFFAGDFPYTVGKVVTEAGSNLVFPLLAFEHDASGELQYYGADPGAGYTAKPEYTAIFGRWLEGREIRIGGDPETYLIRHAGISRFVEMATHEQFLVDTGWTKGTGWTISDGSARWLSEGSDADLYQTVESLADGLVVSVVYTVRLYWVDADASDEGVQMVVGGTAGTLRTESGTYQEMITCGDVDTRLVIRGRGGKGVEIEVEAINLYVASVEADTLYIVRILEDGTELAYHTSSQTGDPATDGLTFVIEGFPTRIWWSAKGAASGARPGSTSVLNFKDLDMPGDGIEALVMVGEYLLAIGRKWTVFLRQNHNALDDDPMTGGVFPRSRQVRGGCMSGRSVAELPNKLAMWLSPECRLTMASVEGLVDSPLSERVVEWLRSYERVDQNGLQHAHAVYDAVHQRYVLFLPESESGGWPVLSDDVPTDPHVDWLP